MKGNFFEQFKTYLLNHHKEGLHEFIPYFETLLQVKNGVQELLDDAAKYYLEIRYEEDDTGGYTDGYFEFHFYTKDPSEDYGWQSSINHYYKMELLLDDRMWGYCDCEPSHIGYNPIYRCCGNGCDWTAPKVSIQKISSIVYHAFDGVQRDMWELESKWKEDTVDHEEELRKKRLEQLSQHIKELEEEKKLLEIN